MGPTALSPWEPMQASFDPTILVGQDIKPIFSSLTTLFVYGSSSIKKTWVTLC